MKIIGFDPASFRNLGWSVVESDSRILRRVESGTFVIDNYPEYWMALWPIFQFVDNLLSVEQPDVVVVEQTSSFGGGKNFVRGQVSHAMGSVLTACGKHHVQVAYVYPTHVKKVITDMGKASKSQMKKAMMIYNRGTKFNSEHAADALANVVCYLIDNSLIDNLIPRLPKQIKKKVKNEET